jgi:hypothetical protein
MLAKTFMHMIGYELQVEREQMFETKLFTQADANF